MFKKLILWIKLKLGIANELNFISGGEALPSPLNEEEEAKTIALYMQGSKEARNSLIEHNLRLVVYIAKKFENSVSDLDDLISIGSLGLIKAVNSFKPDKDIKLATFASRCIENEILMHLRKYNKLRREVSLDEPINVDSEGNILMLADILGSENEAMYKNMEEKTNMKLLDEAFSRLNNKEKDILKLRFGVYGVKKKTQKEIAEELGISQSYISRLEKRIIEKLRKDIEQNA